MKINKKYSQNMLLDGIYRIFLGVFYLYILCNMTHLKKHVSALHKIYSTKEV